MVEKLIIKKSHWIQMKRDVDKRAPEEACGLVAGRNYTSSVVFAMSNILRSPIRYRMDPEEQLMVFQEIEKRELNLLAIYHSHPNGPPHPSQIDLAEAYYPEAFYLIWYRIDKVWDCQGYKIINNSVQKIPIQILDQ
jgi:proteasome lid subunit RPN8/RPN11